MNTTKIFKTFSTAARTVTPKVEHREFPRTPVRHLNLCRKISSMYSPVWFGIHSQLQAPVQFPESTPSPQKTL